LRIVEDVVVIVDVFDDLDWLLVVCILLLRLRTTLSPLMSTINAHWMSASVVSNIVALARILVTIISTELLLLTLSVCSSLAHLTLIVLIISGSLPFKLLVILLFLLLINNFTRIVVV
jgi:hypothetical protein